MPGLDSVQNLHPLTVHLPLAAWPLALAFFLFGVTRSDSGMRRAGRWLVHAASLGAIVAAAFGLWAADQLGHDTAGHDHVHVHRDWMLGTSAVSLLASGLAVWDARRVDGTSAIGVIAALLVTLGLSVVGADYGAYLVFGHGVGMSHQRSTGHPPSTEGHSH